MTVLTAVGFSMVALCVSSSESVASAPLGDLLTLGANLAAMLAALRLDRRRRPSHVTFSEG